jgi:hypothetical protein
MRPTFLLMLALAAGAFFVLVSRFHWSVITSILSVAGVLCMLSLLLVGFAWMFVPAAHRPEMLRMLWDTCRDDVREFGRAISLRG